MKSFVQVSDGFVNLAHVAYVNHDRANGTVTLHFVLPRPAIPHGISYPMGGTPPVGTGHVDLTYTGQDYNEILQALGYDE